MSDSVRHTILQAVQTSFATIVGGENDYTFQWSEVTRMPIKDLKAGRRAVLGVYPTKETKSNTLGPVVNAVMDIVLEIYISRDVGEDLPDLLETALSECERRLMEDQTWGGLAIDTSVEESDTDIGGSNSNAGEASLYFRVLYRHHRDNPANQP